MTRSKAIERQSCIGSDYTVRARPCLTRQCRVLELFGEFGVQRDAIGQALWVSRVVEGGSVEDENAANGGPVAGIAGLFPRH